MSSDLTRRGFLKAAAVGATMAQCSTSADGLSMPDDAQSLDRSVYVSHSKALVEALQTQWYHTQPIPGWGREQNEWNAHCTLDTLLDYTRITGDRAYIDTIRFVAGNKPLLDSAINDGVDDMAWAAIAYVNAYHQVHNKDSLAAAAQIFTTMTHYWDDVCNGGVWWNRKRTYKNAITNELFLVLATSLYEATHQPDYLKWAHREWDWFAHSGMINADSLINDGLDHCRNNHQTTWTYNQGVVLGGLTAMYRFTRQKPYLDQAVRIASAALDRLTTNVNGVSILKEPIAVPNSDQQQFKGTFVKYLAQLALALPQASVSRKRFKSFVCENADAVWKVARNDANEISVYWHGGDQPPIYNATTQTCAIDLLNAAVSLAR
ncbi:MAG: coagulation factor 5/8 type domain protein [Chthonomonadaceae bacterium]|nr:coagulation factor 5/8 type domain protein [Chthonomonadaceae bacterium]